MSTPTPTALSTAVNDHLVLIAGASGSGKTASLRDLQDQAGVLYLNCEAGKKPPFANKFVTYVITDPYDVLAAFDAVAAKGGVKNPKTGQFQQIHTIVIDSTTFLMDMFESLYIVGSANTQAAWGNYFQFWKTLMQDKVASSTCNVICIAHVAQVLNDSLSIWENNVPVKGSLKNNGIEAYFSTVVHAKKMPIKKLEEGNFVEGNDLLEITDEDRLVGYKHVFQTRPTKETANDRIRGPMGLFSVKQTYIDNNAQKLLTHMTAYYA